jgi:uncharacterized protein
MSQPPSVDWIAIAPVKSMALSFLEHVHVGLAGIAGDRAFAVVDPEGRLVNGKRAGRLATIRPAWDPTTRELTLSFPEGQVVQDLVSAGAPVDAIFFGHLRPARSVPGPWDAALQAWTGQPFRLVALPDGEGYDRGPTVTLLATASLDELAAAGGSTDPLDRRRFRMTFGIAGVPAYAEDGWLGRRVTLGGTTVSVAGNVGRCAVTTQDPDTGRPSWDTLRVLQESRGHLPATEPLPFGVWAEVERQGDVAVGDEVAVR